MSYLLSIYRWPLLRCPQVAGFECPVTIEVESQRMIFLASNQGKYKYRSPGDNIVSHLFFD